MKTLYERLVSGEIEHAYTHAGTFHADDVFATALIKYLNPDIKVHRVGTVDADVLESSSVIVYDIGGGKFDHHDRDKLQYRDESIVNANGNTVRVAYAAFGLLWREIGDEVFNHREDIARMYDNMFVRYIDYADNTGIRFPVSVSSMIKSFMDAPGDIDVKFDEAVDVAMKLIRNEFNRLAKIPQDEAYVELCWHQSPSRMIVMPEYHEFNNFVANILNPRLGEKQKVLLVLYPSDREEGHWCVRTIREKGKPNILLPWEVGVINGLTYIHKDAFLADFLDQDSAMKAAVELVNNMKNDV